MRAFLRWAGCAVRVAVLVGLSACSGGNSLKRICVAKGGWRRASVAVRPGAAYTLKLISHDDGRPSTPNRTYFDDVTLS